MICAGIDAGSRTIKVALVDADTFELVASGITDQGVRQEALARELFDDVLKKNGIAPDDVSRIVATGYGRNLVAFADTTVTEITCQAAGVRRLLPDAMTIIDIGGQDSKLINLDADGSVRDFAMNDRCAAGTGRFLEVVAERIGVEISSLGPVAAGSRSPARITSTCVVFAETEITGLLAAGAAPEDIVAGVQASLASRVRTLLARTAQPPVVFTGGVALLDGMVDALEAALAQPVRTAPQPQLTGALGAAIMAGRNLKASTAARESRGRAS